MHYKSQDFDTEASMVIILDEAEKLFSKLIKDCVNKVIPDCTFSKSSFPLSLPLLPPSNEQQSHAFQRPTALKANKTYIERETYIYSIRNL
jgi:hypothetical protein